MVDYSFCCQTVTIYRQTPEKILRQVIPGCFLQWKDTLGESRDFLLIQPGEEQLVFPGDKVFEGIGPEVTLESWDPFSPTVLPGLGEVTYASAYHWEGKFCHTEAGRN